MKSWIRKLGVIALVLFASIAIFLIVGPNLVPSRAYSVSYGIDSVGYLDGALFRPLDVRIAGRLLKGRLFCVQVPQWQSRWGKWLIVDFESEMFFLPNAPPDTHGLNQYFGVPLPDGKIGIGWRVDFSGGRALCYAPTGEWCLLTPTP